MSSKGLYGDVAAPTGMYYQAASPPGAPAGAGLAGAIISALIIGGINSSTHQATLAARAQVKELLDRRDLDTEWRDRLQRAAAAQALFSGSSVEQVKDPIDLEQPGLLVRVTEEHIVTLDTRLLMQTDLGRVHALSSVRIWKKQDHLPQYCRDLVVVSEAAPVGGGAQHWLDAEGDRLSKFLTLAAEQTLWLLALDGGAPSKAPASGEATVQLPDLMTGAPMAVTLSLMETTDQRIVGRGKLRNLDAIVSIPR